MRQTLDETQLEISNLAAGVFARFKDPDRLTTLEASDDAFDRELWAELARTGLLGVAISEAYDGLGLGLFEAALVAEAAGANVALAPVAEVLAASWIIGRHGSADQKSTWLPKIAAGEAIVAFTPQPSAVSAIADGSGASTTLRGELIGVPWAHVSDALIIALGDQLLLIKAAGDGALAAPTGVTTARVKSAEIDLAGVTSDTIGDASLAATEAVGGWRSMLSALQAGAADGAVKMTATYTSSREQFGKPLSTFQGVSLRAADAYIDARAIRSTARQAAWALDHDADASITALTAAWWAAEAGQRCVHSTQHLHGGMGADITYPVHRFFLLGKQIELELGGSSALLAELGEALAR